MVAGCTTYLLVPFATHAVATDFSNGKWPNGKATAYNNHGEQFSQFGTVHVGYHRKQCIMVRFHFSRLYLTTEY